ncbi:TNT domain-containing protein, partial [Pseudothauera rhizosphaerae]
GDLAKKYDWEEGSPQKLALHGLVGLISAKVGDGNLAAGALAGAGQELLAKELSAYLKENGYDYTQIDLADPSLSAEERSERQAEYDRLKGGHDSLLQLGAALAGAAVGTLAGDTQGAATGASTAFVGVTNNFLTHEESSRRLRLKDEKNACTDDACRAEKQMEIDRLDRLDGWRDQQIEQACQSPASPACQAWTTAIQYAAQSYRGQFGNDVDVAERASVLNKAFEYQQTADNPFLQGVGKGLLKLTPPGLVVVGLGAAAMTVQAVVENGATQTLIDIAQGIADLPADLKARLNSSDPTVQGEALVDLVALGTGVTVGTAGVGKVAVNKLGQKLDELAAAKVEAKALAERMKEIAIHADDNRLGDLAEKIAAAERAGWKTAEGKTLWPPENGKVPGTERIIEINVGEKLDRYGGTGKNSSFLAPSGTPVSQRALPDATDLSLRDEYIVMKSFKVEESRATPWFGKEGMGVQFETTLGTGMTIQELVDAGYLIKIQK